MATKRTAAQKRLSVAIDELRDAICDLSDEGWTHISVNLVVQDSYYVTDDVKISKVEELEIED